MYMARATLARFPRMKTSFWPRMFTPRPLAPVSKPLKACFTENRVFRGLKMKNLKDTVQETEMSSLYLNIIMTTIMMGKMEMELPDMYMMNRFMGT